MKSLSIFFLGLVCLLSSVDSFGQELNCTVNLSYDQLFAQQKTDAQTMNQLKTYISEFMNNTRWTTDKYEPNERIKCKLNINLTKSLTQGSFEGNAQLIVTRPVYNSNYESVLISYVDRNFNFIYLPNNPMYFNENNFTDELPFSLAYYANLVLALDYDSFSKQGGSPYIQKAFNLVNIAANSSPNGKSWASGGDTRNRYWLIENLMSQQFAPIRDSFYSYHRVGLDGLTETPGLARRKVLETLNSVKQVFQLRTGSVLINSFFDAKGEEMYNIMKEASQEERQQAFTLLSSMDPAKTEMYRKLVQ